MKVFTILGGVNGVGKTSFLGVLKECCNDLGRMLETDKIVAEPDSEIVDGNRTVQSIIDSCIDRGLSFTQETTLSGCRTEATAKKVKDLGYFVRLFYIGLDSADESLLRIRNRVKRGGHDIPADDVEHRFKGRWEAVAKVLPYCDAAEFYDNDNGFIKVADYKNGELRKVGELSPEWLKELIAYMDI